MIDEVGKNLMKGESRWESMGLMKVEMIQHEEHQKAA